MTTYIVKEGGANLWKKNGLREGFISQGTVFTASESLTIKGMPCWKIASGEYKDLYVEKSRVTLNQPNPDPDPIPTTKKIVSALLTYDDGSQETLVPQS